ncbi:MAG TPA: ABC transporter permease subunit [Burkholderiaceae bacterium]|jgi:ABC-type spermidine/putrescine transport system permease subunit II
MRKLGRVPLVCLGLLLVLTVLPPLAVLVYALSERWDGLLPQGFTLHWLVELLQQSRAQAAAAHTLWLALLSALLALTAGGAATLAANLHSPRLLRLLDALALLPYAIPPVVLAINALELFVGQWGAWLDLQTVYVLLIVPLLFPLVHKSLGAALQQLDAHALLEASRTLGASDAYLLRRVLLPLLAPALLAALMLCWITAAMEFAIANLLLGGSVELLQPLMNSLRGVNGHQAAALIVLTFALLALLGLAVQGLSTKTPWKLRTKKTLKNS